jgi:hydrogenase maturation protease
MNSELVEKIARAVLYEGYCLYPYRPSALKNRQRWNFGVLYPETWAAAQTGSDRSYFQMEVLAVGGAHSRLDFTLRFLHVIERGGGARCWQEAIERIVSIRDLSINANAYSPHSQTLSFPVPGPDDAYRQESLQAEVEIRADPVQHGTFRISIRVHNTTALENLTRDGALLRSLASAHAVLAIRDGEFVSQADPPNPLREAAAACDNVGVWPVLVGEEGEHDTMLGSPILFS